MVQRIQTLFLLGVVISMALIFIAPIWQETDAASGKTITLTAVSYQIEDPSGSVEEKTPAVFIIILAGISAGLAAYAISRYKNRMGQIRVGFLNTLFILGTVAAMILYSRQAESVLAPDQTGEFGWGFFLPVAALVFNSIARRFIMRDERLVREANRIR